MITKQTELRMEVLPDAQIQVREQEIIYEDEVEIAKGAPHRYVVAPGDDTTGFPAMVKDAAKGLHTAQRVQAYRAEAARRET